MFRKEAQRILGEDFNRAVRGAQQNNGAGGRGEPQRRPSRRDSANGQPGDLGIAKAFSSLSTAARKNLSQLAERFSQNNKASRRESGTAREFKPLVGEEVSLIFICN